MNNKLLELMNEKLSVLQEALILETDAAVIFKLKKQIEESERQIAAYQPNIPRPPQPAPQTYTIPTTSKSENRPMKTLKLFYSYSHKDEELRKKLESHLAGLKSQQIVDDWYDRRINPGREWDDALGKNLDQADIVLLLISSDFLNSAYCKKETAYVMEKRKNGSVVVIPIMLRPCVTTGLEFMNLQGAPQDASNNFIPVTKWDNQDEAFTAIVERIHKVAEDVRKLIPK